MTEIHTLIVLGIDKTKVMQIRRIKIGLRVLIQVTGFVRIRNIIYIKYLCLGTHVQGNHWSFDNANMILRLTEQLK